MKFKLFTLNLEKICYPELTGCSDRYPEKNMSNMFISKQVELRHITVESYKRLDEIRLTTL